MELTNYLAEIWGVFLVVMAFAMLLKPKYINMLFSMAEKEEKLFCWGVMNFVIGLAMVLSHNIWVKDWTVIVTIFGWASLLKGATMIFLPKQAQLGLEKIRNASFLSYVVMGVLIIGLVLVYFGFSL